MWVRCTDVKKEAIFINLDRVQTLMNSAEEGGTVVFFGPARDDYIVVTDRPEDILGRAMPAGRAG